MSFRTAAVLSLLVLGLPACLPARAGLPVAVPSAVGGPDTPMPSLAPVMARVTPAVVNIATYTDVQVRNPLFDDPFFRRFFNAPQYQGQTRRTRSAGSGVIVDAKRGYIVTNHHVIDHADEITVTFADGTSVPATLVGSDAQVDLAVLKVDPEKIAADAGGDELPQAQFGDSSKLRVGDFVVAVGNPFALGQTVTSGIVSAMGRSGLGIEGYEDFIQTDASINPGNSGGALVDLRGRLIGINTAILAPSGGNVGIGFAIPANMAHAIFDELVAHGEVRRGHLGLQVQQMNADLASAFGETRRHGVVVTGVEADSPAAAAGFQVGDVITRMGDREVKNEIDYRARAAVVMVGDTVPFDVSRGGKAQRLAVLVPKDQFEKLDGARLHPALAGTSLQNLREPSKDRASGVQILDVDQGSVAWQLGLRGADVIVAANGEPALNLSDLTADIKRNPARTQIRILREGQFYDLRLPR